MKLLLISLLFLTAACNDSCYWRYQEIDACLCKSELLHYSPYTNCNGIDLEFLKGSYGTLGYVGVFCKTIPPSELNSATSEVVIGIDGEGMRYYAFRMCGGQRLLLPDEAVTSLLAAFSAGKTVLIGLDGGYYAEIPAADFKGFKN